MSDIKICNVLFFFLSFFAGLSTFTLGEGFGVNKLVVDLVRVRPPQFFLFANAVFVKASSPDPSKGAVAQRLRSAAETGILGNHQRIAQHLEQADTVIEVTLLESNIWESTDIRKKKEYKKVGEEKVWNDKKQKYETKDKYADVEVTEIYKVLNGILTANYRLADPAGNSLDTYTFNSRFRREYKNGIDAPDFLSVEDTMTSEVARGLARRLFPYKESLQVLVPKGSFEDLGKLAQEGQWSRYLASLNQYPPKKKPADDAYRQYAIGVAYEALAYQNEDQEATLKYLGLASAQYNKAMEENREEKFFSSGWRDEMSPIERARSAVVQYQKYKEFKAAREKWEASPQALGPSRPEKASTHAPSGSILKNSDIIEMVRAGLSEQNVILAVDAAEKTDFDLTPSGLIGLSKAGVSNEVIAYLQKKKVTR